MITRPEPDCWLHPAVEVRSSPIEGHGLFATEAIPEGTAVSRVGGRLVSEAELLEAFRAAAALPDPAYIDTIAVAADRHLILPPRRDNGYGNHSCDPNLWWTDAYTLTARRDIAPGEELTNDYGTSTGRAEFRMACRCASPLCRGSVTGDDWRRDDLRARYGRHWIPLLLTWIEGSQG